RYRRFAEYGVLLRLVGEVGPEEVVLGRSKSPGEFIGSAEEGRRQRVKPVYEQVLRVVALAVAVEAAQEPLEAISAAGQAWLRRPRPGGGGVVERRVDRVDVRRDAEAGAGDARGQDGGVAHHEAVPVRSEEHTSEL